MKLTKKILVKLINETIEHNGLSCGEVHPAHTHNEWEEHKKEEDVKTKAMAKISIKPVAKLKESDEYDERDPQQKHTLGPDALERFAYTEESYSLKDELKHILRKWENTEYDSDEHRWQEYAADIQDLIAEPLRLGVPKEEDPMQRNPPSRLRQTVMKET